MRPSEPGDRSLVDPDQVVDQHADEARAQAGELQPGEQPGGGAAAAEGDDDVRGLRQLAGLDLLGELDRRLDVADAAQGHGSPGAQEVGEVQRRAGAPQHQRGGEPVGAQDAGGQMELGAAGAHPLELAANVLRLGLRHQHEHGPHPEPAGEQRAGQAVIGAQRPAGEDRALAAALGVGQQPLELPRLVAAEAAVGAVVLDPHRRLPALVPQAGQLAHRGRPLPQPQAFQVDLEWHRAAQTIRGPEGRS